MTVANRRVVFPPHGELTVYGSGLRAAGPALVESVQRDDDDLALVADFAPWLAGDTLSSVTRSASGVTVSGTSNTTTTATQKLKGQGYVDIKVVTAGGNTMQFRVRVGRRLEGRFQADRYDEC